MLSAKLVTHSYSSVKDAFGRQRRLRVKKQRKVERLEKCFNLVDKLTCDGVNTLNALKTKFYAENEMRKVNPQLTQEQSDKLLYDILRALSADFGPQSTVNPSDRDISAIDFKNDKKLQVTLDSIEQATEAKREFKVSGEEELKQLLTKIPVAFISAGVNPNDPRSKGKNSAEEHEKLRSDLKSQGYTFIEVDGYYDGAEKSFMVILDQQVKTKTFREFLAAVDPLTELGRKYNQDSLLFVWGAAQFYYYPDKGTLHYASEAIKPEYDRKKDKVRYGEGFTIYNTRKDELRLPNNYYSEIGQSDESLGRLRYQLNISFDYEYNLNLFEILCEFKIQTRFDSYYRVGHHIPSTQTPNLNRAMIITRGVEGINEEAMKLKMEFAKRGVLAYIIASDAHIADLNHAYKEFVKTEQYQVWKNTPEGLEWQKSKEYAEGILHPCGAWNPYIRNEMIKRNQHAVKALLENKDASVIILADLNKQITFFKGFCETAATNNVDCVAWEVGYKHDDINHSYVERHIKEVQCKGESEVVINDRMTIPQYEKTKIDSNQFVNLIFDHHLSAGNANRRARFT